MAQEGYHARFTPCEWCVEIADWRVGSLKAKKLYTTHPVLGLGQAVSCGRAYNSPAGYNKLLFEN